MMTPIPVPQVDPATGEKIVEGWAAAEPLVEVVLFQDCWMSTLETAYELQDVVKYVIASQSLLPIGTKYADFVWPYEQLLRDLLTDDYDEQLAEHIGGFYKSHVGKIATLVALPIALLDLHGVKGITQALTDLLKSLQILTADERGLLIETGQIVRFAPPPNSSDLAAGDGALMDLRQMCTAMEAHADQGIRTAASALLGQLDPLIREYIELNPTGEEAIGFGGISVLYTPPPERLPDNYVKQALFSGSYEKLRFSTETSWPAMGQNVIVPPNP